MHDATTQAEAGEEAHEPVWGTRVVETHVEVGRWCRVLHGDAVGGSDWRQFGPTRWRYRVFAARTFLVLDYGWSNAHGVYRRELIIGQTWTPPLEPMSHVAPGLTVWLRARGKQSYKRALAYATLCQAHQLLDATRLHVLAHQWLLAGLDPCLLIGRHHRALRNRGRL
jgi:hypothetical protein